MVEIEGRMQNSPHQLLTHLQAALRDHGRKKNHHGAKHTRLPPFGNQSGQPVQRGKRHAQDRTQDKIQRESVYVLPHANISISSVFFNMETLAGTSISSASTQIILTMHAYAFCPCVHKTAMCCCTRVIWSIHPFAHATSLFCSLRSCLAYDFCLLIVVS